MVPVDHVARSTALAALFPLPEPDAHLSVLHVAAFSFPFTQSIAAKPKVVFPDLYEATIAELQDGLTRRHFTSVDLVKVTLELSFPE